MIHFYKKHIINSQKGAMFGMDARIALAIFAGLSVIVGTSIVNNAQETRAKALAKEMRAMVNAVESIHNDLGDDLHDLLTVNNSQNAFIALYDSSVLVAEARIDWLGPYIDLDSDTHPRYGNMRVLRAQADHATACQVGTQCYLWISYSEVPLPAIIILNDIFDGEAASPDTSGRIHYGAGNPATVWYQISRTLSCTAANCDP